MSSKNVLNPGPAAASRTRPPPSWSLAARLTAWYAGSGFLLILLATGFLYWFLVSNLEREDDELLTDKVRILRGLLREKPSDARALEQEVEWEWAASRHAQFSMRILDENGKSLLETPGMVHELPVGAFPDADTAGTEPARGTELRTRSGKSYRLLAARAVVGLPGGRARVL